MTTKRFVASLLGLVLIGTILVAWTRFHTSADIEPTTASTGPKARTMSERKRPSASKQQPPITANSSKQQATASSAKADAAAETKAALASLVNGAKTHSKSDSKTSIGVDRPGRARIATLRGPAGPYSNRSIIWSAPSGVPFGGPQQRFPQRSLPGATQQIPGPPAGLPFHASSEPVAGRAQELTADSLKLVAKGAPYSARAKMLRSLQLIADALDAQTRTNQHNRALAAGLRAIEESEDFVRAEAGMFGSGTLAVRVAAHKTPVLKNVNPHSLSKMSALQAYYAYATRQIAVACGHAPEASNALYYLARLQPYLKDRSDGMPQLVEARSMAFQQAALLVDPQNFRAANELGVLLARQGQLEPAVEALNYSASLGNRPETLQNLAVVYKKLGNDSMASSALAYSEKAKKLHPEANQSGAKKAAASLIEWVDNETFVAVSSSADMHIPSDRLDTTESNNNAVEKTTRVQPKPAKRKTPTVFDAFKRSIAQFGQHASSKPSEKPPIKKEASKTQLASHAIQPEPDDESIEPIPEEPAPETTTDDTENIDTEADIELPPMPWKSDGPSVYDGLKRFPAAAPAPMPIPGRPPMRRVVERIPWEVFAQGEYIGPARIAHVPEYFLRVDDVVEFVYRLKGTPTANPYELNVADQIRVESVTVPNLNRDLLIQPDGTIVLPQVGTIYAAGKTVEELRKSLQESYRQFYREPSIGVIPLVVNQTLEELRATIDNRSGVVGGQAYRTRVSPDGTVQLPAVGSVSAQGLTLAELQTEVELRYSEIVHGIEVTPVLAERAPRAIYVLGEVPSPGRIVLEGPTTVIQAIAMAGSWNIGADVDEVIVLRRDDQWRLLATRVDVRDMLYNDDELHGCDIWLRDSDIVIVPKMTIQVVDDWIELVFTRGIYGVFPFSVSLTYFKDLSTMAAL